MHSRFFENVVAELVAMTDGESELKVRRALQNSRMLSSDVSAAYDPMYADVFEKRSSAFFGKGLVFNKFTGSVVRVVLMMPMQSTLQRFVVSWMMQTYLISSPNLEKLTQAAVEQLLTSWQITAWKS